MKSRIGELIFFLINARKRGAILKGNSAFEKELNTIINAPIVVCPKSNPVPFIKPTPYELEYGLPYP